MKKNHRPGKARDIDPSATPILKLKRQTVRNLTVKTGVRTGPELAINPTYGQGC